MNLSLEFLISTMVFIALIGLLINSIKSFEKEGIIQKFAAEAKDSYCSVLANSAYSTNGAIKVDGNCHKKNLASAIFDMNW